MLVQFGTDWCGYCRAIGPILVELLQTFPEVNHLVVEDGPGRPLGRSFGVKLWPTLVFLKEGRIVQQSVRPGRTEIAEGFRRLRESVADN